MSTTAPEPAVLAGPVDANNNANHEQTVQTAPTNPPDVAPTASQPQTAPTVNAEPKSDPKEPGADKAPISPQTGPAATQASSTTAPNPSAAPVPLGVEAVQPSTTPIPPSVPAPISQPAVVNKLGPILCINPNKALFSTAGGISKHLMINKSTDRLAIKIRSSNNFFFRVNPVYSFLDCQSVNELEVIRLAGGGAKQTSCN